MTIIRGSADASYNQVEQFQDNSNNEKMVDQEEYRFYGNFKMTPCYASLCD